MADDVPRTEEKTSLAKDRLEQTKEIIEEVDKNPRDWERNKIRIRHIVGDLYSVFNILKTEFSGVKGFEEWEAEKKKELSEEGSLGRIVRNQRHLIDHDGKRRILPISLTADNNEQEGTDEPITAFSFLDVEFRTSLTSKTALHLCKKYYEMMQEYVDEAYERFPDDRREKLSNEYHEVIQNAWEEILEGDVGVIPEEEEVNLDHSE